MDDVCFEAGDSEVVMGVMLWFPRDDSTTIQSRYFT
jgi:hypothetical protein